jgi:hypothetical protein
VAGAQGIVGAQGAQGSVGVRGTQGAVGVSGAAGPLGVQGAAGAVGAQGTTGVQGAQGVAGAAIARFESNAVQNSVTTGTDIGVATTVVNNIPGVSVLATIITLPPGTYRLTGAIGAINSSVQVRPYYGFFNRSASTWIGTGGQTASGTATNWHGMPYAPATAVITTATTITVSLRVNSGNGLPATISGQGDFATARLGNSWVTIVRYG